MLFFALKSANVEDNYVPGNPTSFFNDVSGRVWLDASKDTSLLHRMPLEYKGVVVSRTGYDPAKFIDSKELIVAYRLEKGLDLPEYDLPDLPTLAAITDQKIVGQYLEKYLLLSLSAGIDYMLIPDLNSYPDQQKKVLEQLIQLDSSFFLDERRLKTLEKVGKKQLKEVLSSDGIALVGPELLPKLNKTLKKLDKNPIPVSRLVADRQRPEPVHIPTYLWTSIYQHAVTHLVNGESLLPVQEKEIALLSTNPHGPLSTELSRYFKVKDITLQPPAPGQPVVIDARNSAEEYLPYLQQYRYTNPIIALVSAKTGAFIEADEYLYFTENLPLHDELIPQMLFGAIGIVGQSPGNVAHYADLQCTVIPSFGKLRFTSPEWEGLSSDTLELIQDIVQEMISDMAAPGCQVTVIKGGSIVYEKSFGYLTYDSLINVRKNTIYDVASVTKVLGTLLCVMSLEEQGKLVLDDSIASYLPQYANSNKGHITIRQLLAHQSGLRAYEPLWKRTLKGDFLEPFSYYSAKDEEEDKRSYGYPIHPVMMDSVRSWLIQSPLTNKQDKYRYSDIGFMILQQVVEAVTRMSMEQYLFENFYHPMGLHYTVFNPLDKEFEIFEIAPTEFDKYYRDELVWGTVHDRNAAICGGVAGHAGRFSSSREMAILMHMVLNGGYYGGRQYLQPETIARFNQKYFAGNRRALGWDKTSEKVGNTSVFASAESFGHTGFTGAMVWADPAYDLVYTFVSNRIYPDSENRRLIKGNIRNRIQEVIYRSVIKD